MRFPPQTGLAEYVGTAVVAFCAKVQVWDFYTGRGTTTWLTFIGSYVRGMARKSFPLIPVMPLRYEENRKTILPSVIPSVT